MELSGSPVATIILIATVGLSFYALFKNQALYERLLLHPYSLVRRNRWHTLITSGFIHGDLIHLAFNMMTFYFFAIPLEGIIGSFNFIIIYFGSMILADISALIREKDNPTYRALGASGGISGILFSFILFVPTSSIGVFLLPIGIPAPIFAILYIAYCYYADKHSQDNVAHDAHLWGALAGLIITIALVPEVIQHFFDSIF